MLLINLTYGYLRKLLEILRSDYRMILKEEDNFEIKEIKLDFNALINKSYISKNKKEELINSDIIFLPLENFRKNVPLVFHSGTADFYKYLKINSIEFQTSLCIEEEDYKEIILHNNTFRFGELILNLLVAPLIVNALWYYISSKLLAKNKDRIEVNIKIVNKKENTYTEIDFKGSVENFENKVINKFLEQNFKNKDRKED